MEAENYYRVENQKTMYDHPKVSVHRDVYFGFRGNSDGITYLNYSFHVPTPKHRERMLWWG